MPGERKWITIASRFKRRVRYNFNVLSAAIVFWLSGGQTGM